MNSNTAAFIILLSLLDTQPFELYQISTSWLD